MKVTPKATATGKKDEKAKVLENNTDSEQRLRASSEQKDMLRSQEEEEVRVRRSASMSRTGRGKVASKEVTRSGAGVDNDVMAVDDATTKTKATMVVRLHPGHLQKIAANSQKQVSRLSLLDI